MISLAKNQIHKEDVLNIATLTTFSRFFLTILGGYLIVNQSFEWALIVLGIAGFTDFLDGWFARIFSCKSAFGQWLDPLADKCMLLLIFLFSPLIGSIVLCLEIIGRELSTKIRERSRKHYIAPGSKYITCFQMVILNSLILNSLLNLQSQALIQSVLLGSLCYLSFRRFAIYKKEYTLYLKKTHSKNPLDRFSTVANYITLLGFFLVPFIVWLFQSEAKIWGLIVYGIAWSTDFWDGFVAKKYNQQTTFGQRLDPLRDKLLLALPLYLCMPLFSFFLIAVIEIISAIYFDKEKQLTGKHTITQVSRVITLFQGIALTYVLALFIGLNFPISLNIISWLITILSAIRALSYIHSFYWEEVRLKQKELAHKQRGLSGSVS